MVTVRVPATSANLGPGFDLLGLALPLYNTVTLDFADALSITNHGPEAQGLRHLAFRFAALEPFIERLASHGVDREPIRVDEYTGRRFTFFADPDGLPLELYEVG